MPITALCPTEESLAAAAWHLQRLELPSLGNGIDSGFAITRNSASSVTVAAGIAIGALARVPVVQAVLSGIPVASSGKHRYDMVVVDLGDGTTKRIEGTEEVPSGRYGRSPLNDFLENYLPLPSQILLTYIPLYCLRITENGLVTGTFGNYVPNNDGIAPISIGSPFGKFLPTTGTSESTASEQTIAHGLGAEPSKIVIYATDPDYPVSAVFGTQGTTNMKFTVSPAGRAYRWFAYG
jgi:hypothetical protein